MGCSPLAKDDRGASRFALQMAHSLRVLPEAEMRRLLLAEQLAHLSDEDTVEVIGQLSRHGRDDAGLEVAVLALAQVLEHEDLGYERVVDLYQIAKARGDELVARLLLAGGRQPGSSRPQIGEAVSEPSMSLGWRKAHARGRRRDMLDRLLHDPDASVLAILLQNPRVIERDAVLLAARRPTTADAQRAVFASRHAASHLVRLALVQNPYTPVDLATRILPGLPVAELQDVAQAQGLAPSLRQAAQALLRARDGTEVMVVELEGDSQEG